MGENETRIYLEGIGHGPSIYYPIEMLQYLCKHGEKSTIYLTQKYDDYGKISCKGNNKYYCAICRADLLKESSKKIVFSENVCKRLASIDYAHLKKEKAFALRGYNSGDLIFVDSLAFQSSEKDEYECAVNMTSEFKVRQVMWTKIKYSNEGTPFVFFGHAHTRPTTPHPYGEKLVNYPSLADLVEVRDPKENKVAIMFGKKTIKSAVIDFLTKGVKTGMCMINPLGDITAVVANDKWDLETIKDIRVLQEHEFKNINQFCYNGTYPFGVFRDNKNYILPEDKDMWEIVDAFEKLSGSDKFVKLENNEEKTLEQ